MAGHRGQFFSVSEALQAILDQASDGENEEWEDDGDVLDCTPSSNPPLSPVPSTSRGAIAQTARGETHQSSTPKRKNTAGSSLPTPKRHCIALTESPLTVVSDDESLTEASVSNPTASVLADEYLAANPALEPDPVNEATTIAFVHSKVAKGCGCTKKCFERISVTAEEIFIHRLNVTEISRYAIGTEVHYACTNSFAGCSAYKPPY